MSGVKGMKGGGGARPNTGGARPGAGRPRKGTERTRGSVWMATRGRILERDGHKCRCGACQASGMPKTASEVDHIIPLSDGGADSDSNLQSLNSECHKAKTKGEAQKRAASQYSPSEARDDSLEFLRVVMKDMEQDPRLRVRAAIALAQYEHAKVGEMGKKDAKNDAAKVAATGRFASPAAPKLTLVKSA